MAKKLKFKHKKKKIILDEGESNAKIFVAKYLKDYNNGVLTQSELDSTILDLIVKFNVSEVVQYLSSEQVSYLRELAKYEEKEEHIFVLAGCFGPEFDYDKYVAERKKNFNKAIAKLKIFFASKK